MEVEEGEEEASVDEGETSYLPPKEGEMLVIKRVLHATEAQPEANQTKQIFHSRCRVANKTYNLIIDEGSCTNIASTEMVNKLNLATIIHPRPYTLHWLRRGFLSRLWFLFQLVNIKMRFCVMSYQWMLITCF